MARQGIDEIEEGLSRWIGDIAAHQLGRALRGAAGFGERVGRALAANVREYLQEESRDLVPRTEMEEFAEEVTETQAGVEALEARINALREGRRG